MVSLLDFVSSSDNTHPTGHLKEANPNQQLFTLETILYMNQTKNTWIVRQ